ncbi:type 1 glutamine amidotransferase [Saccharothrix algeriensis]|uniref:GMP synthase-like glutamine amidotransferase n=1 Tax=Saccharothrix algeriensis TaxID=173560 RepID=A0A8T8I3P3_9PSEU|nr:type 1 glutamine amidotransferase [Saccharothrix algeriensis]MBM7811070.1 GMP synthase-like glutamine amidotransferase [Saccharothrix algeriensis]QTR05020.1 type 1 glutamine amidotransferase [Saccharothrix algeriensis]
METPDPAHADRLGSPDRAAGPTQLPPHVLLLQHAHWEVPAIYGDLLREAGWRLTTCRPYLGDAFPAWDDFDGILAMGGPMSANDVDELPWLGPERRLIAEAAAAGKPFFGVCLGSQLLAAALGAKVYPGPLREYGVHEVRTAPAAQDDPLFGGLPQSLRVFQWHGETFDLPAGAELLVEGDPVRNQAFRFGRAYGLQFHAEVSPALLTEWLAVDSCARELVDEVGADAPAELAAELATEDERMQDLAGRVFGSWMRLVETTRQG